MRARRLGLALAAWLALAAGGTALARVEPPVLPAKGTVQAAFAPDDDVEGLLADAIGQAREQVLVQAYLLSNKVITRALLDAHGRGIDVRVLADREQMMRS
ncbi:endonuclease, partial [Ralstonia solanacearum]